MPLTPGDEFARLLAGPGATAPSDGRLGVPLDDLRVQVEGIGALGRPVTRTQADKLCSLGAPAPYGRGEETLVDSTVRHTWQIPTGLVEVDWAGHLDAVLEEARTQLGLPPGSRLEAELHSMLVYEKGQFFLPHQDSEKDDAMVATLVLTLPTIHQGGELVVHEGSRTTTYPASRTDPTLTVMYADRLHEVLPVRSGHRISLTYNLILAAAAAGVSAPEDEAGQAALLLDRHFRTRPRPRWPGDHREPPQRYAYLLDHMYTQHGLTWAKLKGVDIDRVALLRAAAERTGCEVALALAEIHETRDAMDPEWNDEVGHLIDEEIVLTHWQAPGQGERLRPVQLALGSHEVGASTPTVGLTPYSSEYEGYMGNYGNTMDRWYRRAAVLVWPTALGFANRAATDPAWALADLTRRLRTPEPQGQDDRDRVEADLRSLHPFWAATVRGTSEPLLRDALEVAALLDQPEDAAFLVEPFDITRFGPGEAAAFGEAVDRYGEGWGRERLRSWVGADRHYGGLAAPSPWLSSLPQTCAGLAGAPGCAEELISLAWSQLEGRLRLLLAQAPTSSVTEALAVLGTSMAHVLEAAAGAGNTSVRDQIISSLTAESTTLPVTRSLLRSAQAWNDEVWRAASGDSLAAFAAATLEQRLASPPRAADDWSIPLPPGCDCELCRTLGTFLTDAAREHLEWPLATPGRRHIHSRIDLAELPVTHHTRRSGRPYTLVLTKTRELFTRDVAARQHARADLAELEDAATTRTQRDSVRPPGTPRVDQIGPASGDRGPDD